MLVTGNSRPPSEGDFPDTDVEADQLRVLVLRGVATEGLAGGPGGRYLTLRLVAHVSVRQFLCTCNNSAVSKLLNETVTGIYILFILIAGMLRLSDL